jgi:DNA-binding NarL/FixJ family response regulator
MSKSQTSIRVVVADDHPLVREGLRTLLAQQPEFVVVGEAGDGIEAVERATALKPDVLLLDLAMPRLHGLDVLKALGEAAPDVKIVLLTAAIEREEAALALRAGARGIVLKESATHLLYKCIRVVMDGEFWVGHERIDDLLRTLREIERARSQARSPASTLTARELQVIAAVVEGASNKDIGKTFGLSGQTVKNHLSNIFDKLGVSNRLELALYAVHHRLVAGVPAGADRASEPSRGPSTSAPRRRQMGLPY